jgi:hypothetical protein
MYTAAGSRTSASATGTTITTPPTAPPLLLYTTLLSLSITLQSHPTITMSATEQVQLQNFPSIFSVEGKVAVVTGGSRGLGLYAASGYSTPPIPV